MYWNKTWKAWVSRSIGNGIGWLLIDLPSYLHIFLCLIISWGRSNFRVLGSRSRLTWLRYFLWCENLKIWMFTVVYLNVKVIYDLYIKVTGLLFLHSHNYYMSWNSPVQWLPTPSSLVRGDLYHLRRLAFVLLFLYFRKRRMTIAEALLDTQKL